MSGKLVKNLSANTLQLIVNQIFGLIIFIVLSTSLDKSTFGQINLSLAILLAVFNILSFGIDQIVVKKIASGNNPEKILSTYLVHVLLSGSLFYVLLILVYLLFPQLFGLYKLLLFIGLGKLAIYFSTPFKQIATGFEKFATLSRMSVISNIVRGSTLAGLAFYHAITLNCVIIIFIAGDVIELIVTIILSWSQLKIPVRFKWDFQRYRESVKEAIPQLGVVIITSALARFDWIFIGIMVSAAKLAEYSFAYKIFEMATLPLLALAPLLIPRFTHLFKSEKLPLGDIWSLLRVEMAAAVLIALVTYLGWVPVVDLVTKNKYGSVNSNTILILSLCMPFLYLNNFLWTASFAEGRLKMIFGVILITFVVNLGGDLILIPLFKNEGAAIAYLLAMVGQSAAYLKNSTIREFSKLWQPLATCLLCGLISIGIAKYLFTNNWLALMAGVGIYAVCIAASKQLRLTDIKSISNILG